MNHYRGASALIGHSPPFWTLQTSWPPDSKVLRTPFCLPIWIPRLRPCSHQLSRVLSHSITCQTLASFSSRWLAHNHRPALPSQLDAPKPTLICQSYLCHVATECLRDYFPFAWDAPLPLASSQSALHYLHSVWGHLYRICPSLARMRDTFCSLWCGGGH